MARNIHQQRKMATSIGLIVVLGIVALAIGKDVLAYLEGPKLPGYVATAPAGVYAALDWTALHQGQWPAGGKPVIPAPVVALTGKAVCLKGFLLPLHQGADSTQFYLAEKPRGCFFCNPPGIADVVELNTLHGARLPVTDWPVTVYGTLHPATGAASDQTLYTIDDAVLHAGR